MENVKTLEAKKPQQAASKSNDSVITGSGVIDFISDVKAELYKISWTSPEELRVYTKIVVGMTFFLGMGIYVVDLLIQSFLSGLGFLFHLIS